MNNIQNFPEVVKTFLEIVQIDNPSKEEDELILWLVDQLTAIGVDSLEQDTIGNVIARIDSNIENNNEYIMLVAHLDSVYPCKGIKPIIKEHDGDYIINSEGDTILSADDKAGIAAIIEAIKTIKKENFKHPNIELVFTVQEEIGLRGAKSMDFTKYYSQIAYAIDAEAPVGTIISQGPTQKHFEVKFTGRSSHAGMAPEKGINAIKIASEFLNNITLGRIDEVTTSNIGLIKGGVANNIVPESVYLKGEVRSLYESKLDGIVGSYKMEAEKVIQKYEGASFFFNELFIYHGFYVDPDDNAVKLAIKACENIGIEANVKAIGSGSDANIFNFNEIKTVILGAGFKNSHSNDEYITVSELKRLTSLLINLVKEAK